MEKVVSHRLFVMVGVLLLMLCTTASAAVVFQENFDNQADWSVSQRTDTATSCYSNCSVPTGWTGYYNGLSYCPGGPGNNNMYIRSANARGGTGKAITYYDESCVDYFEDSDGQLFKDFGQEYDELYIRFYIKFQTGYQWENDLNNPPQHKLIHLQHYCGSGNPFAYRGQTNYDCNKPFAIVGIYIYNNTLYYYFNAACEEDCMSSGPCCAPYSWDAGAGWDGMDIAALGNFNTLLGDGNWHYMEFRFKINTNTGTTFKNDGIHTFWLDGVQRYTTTTFPYGQAGGDTNPRRGFRIMTIGGNNSNRWTRSCSGTSCEQWYAIDDLVVATEYIGPGTPPSLLPPEKLGISPPTGN